MSAHTLEINVTGSSRNELRRKVIEQFFREEAGTGRGDKTSRYTYYVEKLEDGNRIFLTRPAYLKKGFDFVIRVEGKIFLNGKDNPSHNDIFGDLKRKKRENPRLYERLHEAMTRVYNCEEPEDVLRDLKDMKFQGGFSTELILKVLKWFFIEQDIRDWNYSGRGMFKSGLDEIRDT
jgi:hypothetical protein